MLNFKRQKPNFKVGRLGGRVSWRQLKVVPGFSLALHEVNRATEQAEACDDFASLRGQ